MSQEAVMTLAALEDTIRRRRADAAAAGKEEVAAAAADGERLIVEAVRKAEQEIKALRQRTEAAATAAARESAAQLSAKKDVLRSGAEARNADAVALIVERIVNG